MSRSRKGGRGSKVKRRPVAPASALHQVEESTASTNGREQDVLSQPVTTSDPPAPARRKRFTPRRVLLGIAAVALLLFLGGVAYAYWTVQRALPSLSGTVSVPGLSAPVTVTRDAQGVPHIVAANVEDLFAAQGYVHAQDRLFQMFYFKRLGAGRLAEAFGPAAAKPDIFLRTVGMRRAAESELALLSPEVRKGLEAYARGVNAFVNARRDNLPVEFGILGITMDEWGPVDTLAFGKVMAWDLGNNWESELTVADLQATLGPTRTAQLYPDYPPDAPVIVPRNNSGSASPLLAAFNRDVRPWLPSAGLRDVGSNNWVVDGTKSATGKPLLSNDPHLGVQNPSIWYQVQLTTTDGKYDVAGYSFAGAPGVVVGHNREIGWGVTNASTDVQDIFIERLDPTRPGQYQTADGWKPLTVLTETILVKGSTPVTQTVRLTNHGPILKDAFDTIYADEPISATIGNTMREPYALQWTALKPGRLIEAIYDLQTASNWQEFRAALSKWSVPGQNFVYADREGNIGYQMTGDQPVRRKGDGKSPVPGWTGEYDWQEASVPYDELPRSYNPPEHYIATANNKSFGEDYPYPIEGEWSAPWRISRIVEMLEAKEKLSPDDFKAMLMDTSSPLARKVAPLLAALKPQDTQAQEAVKLFNGWDGNLSAESAAAAVYEVTIQTAISETFSDDLGFGLFVEYAGSGGNTALRSLEVLLDKPDDPFWDRTDTPDRERRDDILLRSLNRGLPALGSVAGTDISGWTWGKLHTITPRHNILGSQPLISGMFNLNTLPFGGDGTTVSVSSYNLLLPFDVANHQSFRMILDASDWSKSLGVYAGGQSGQPGSQYWGSQLSAWQRGEFYPMLYTPEQVEADKAHVLTLNP